MPHNYNPEDILRYTVYYKDSSVSFEIGDWCQASRESNCLIGKVKHIREDGLITLKNISLVGNDIQRFAKDLVHTDTPYTTAYNTHNGYGAGGGDKTKGSYPYFKKMIDAGHK